MGSTDPTFQVGSQLIHIPQAVERLSYVSWHGDRVLAAGRVLHEKLRTAAGYAQGQEAQQLKMLIEETTLCSTINSVDMIIFKHSVTLA